MSTRDVAVYPGNHPIIKWLLESDPAIRWQVQRDLLGAAESIVAQERSLVATLGWGARLFAMQSPRGHWGGEKDVGPYMTTIYQLELLVRFGVDPLSAPAKKMILRLVHNIFWRALDGRPFFEGETEPCINGAILNVGAYFQVDCFKLLERLLDEQLPDGGWNCEAPRSQVSSFNTIIRVLEGLRQYEKSFGPSVALTRARMAGEKYLLERGLFRSKRFGDVVSPAFLKYAFPPTWHYDVLWALDYFREAYPHPTTKLLAAVEEAVAHVMSRMHQNSRWPLNAYYGERMLLTMEAGVGRASRWNTLRALRVLNWFVAG